MNLSAIDDEGKAVDWWFIYKVPKLTKGADTHSARGYEYVYYDPNAKALAQSPNDLDSGKGALNDTLQSAFGNPSDTTGWILYNDEKPTPPGGGDDGSLGHTKGVIAFDTATDTAFWLLHSWPKYAAPGVIGMPTPMYGQTFMCISLDLDTAGKIAEQMTNHQEPQVFNSRIPKSLDQGSGLYKLSEPLNPNAPGDSDVLDFTSRGGLPFKVIAKNRKWGKDFWNDLVGPTLGSDMDVETWIRGKIPPTLDSDGIHKTFDVKYIDLRSLGDQWIWPETHDHAKWGLTVDSDWICVGDINRMVSQEARGGGTIAFQDKTLWTALSQTDKIIAPPGHSEADAKKLIQKTHPTTKKAS